MAEKETVSVGPWGGSGGNSWEFKLGSNTPITSIVINSGDAVDSLTFLATDQQGRNVFTAKCGGNGGSTATISLNWPDEHLTFIYGTTAIYSNVVTSLTFQTNIKTYGPYGVESGNNFEADIGNAEIVGFFGRAGALLDAIGIYVKPLA